MPAPFLTGAGDALNSAGATVSSTTSATLKRYVEYCCPAASEMQSGPIRMTRLGLELKQHGHAKTSLIPLQDITSWSRFDHLIIFRPQRRLRLHFLASIPVEPFGPRGPPATRMVGREFEPL